MLRPMEGSGRSTLSGNENICTLIKWTLWFCVTRLSIIPSPCICICPRVVKVRQKMRKLGVRVVAVTGGGGRCGGFERGALQMVVLKGGEGVQVAVLLLEGGGEGVECSRRLMGIGGIWGGGGCPRVDKGGRGFEAGRIGRGDVVGEIEVGFWPGGRDGRSMGRGEMGVAGAAEIWIRGERERGRRRRVVRVPRAAEG